MSAGFFFSRGELLFTSITSIFLKKLKNVNNLVLKIRTACVARAWYRLWLCVFVCVCVTELYCCPNRLKTRQWGSYWVHYNDHGLCGLFWVSPKPIWGCEHSQSNQFVLIHIWKSSSRNVILSHFFSYLAEFCRTTAVVRTYLSFLDFIRWLD